MPRSAPDRRPISSGRAVRSGMRIRAGDFLRWSRSRPTSAAAARSDSGFAMVEASTRDRPTDTSVAITNIWSTRSRSLRTIASISPALEASATVPSTRPSCTMGEVTAKNDPSSPLPSLTSLGRSGFAATMSRS